MKKISFASFLLQFIVANLLSLALYIVTEILINVFTGGALSKISGAGEPMGWSADDVSLGLRIFLNIFLVTMYFLMLISFYVFLYWRTSRNKDIHDDFMKSIGAIPFDRKEFSSAYIKTGLGKYELRYFCIIIGVEALVTVLGIPFLTILMISQDTVSMLVTTFTPLKGIVRNVVQAILIVVVNIPLFYLYQTKFAPRIFEKWASKRLRIESKNTISSNVNSSLN